MEYVVEVVEYGSEKIEKRIPCGPIVRKAEMVDAGVNRNLNHEAYYTRIVKDNQTAPTGA